MASLEKRENGSWRIIFRYKGKRHSFTIPPDENGQPITAIEAEFFVSETEKRLRLIKQNLLTIRGSIENFLAHRGNPPSLEEKEQEPKPRYTLGMLRDRYLESSAFLHLCADSHRVVRCYFAHLSRILGESLPLDVIVIRDFQQYIDTRSRETSQLRLRNPSQLKFISASTIKHELKILRAAWNWARCFDVLDAPYPISRTARLRFPKYTEKLPFMTIAEAEELMSNGLAGSEVYDSVYLTIEEVQQLLDHVKQQKLPKWVYPMFVCAAHTGARRSELLRAYCSDVNFDSKGSGTIRIREMKRDPNKVTYRTVPLSPLLCEVLRPVLRKGGALFCSRLHGHIERSVAQKYLHKALRRSPWAGLRGWHVFRHTYRSLLTQAGIDERMIDGLMGHSTEEQRRRYRHLYPKDKDDAVRSVFGANAEPFTQQQSSDQQARGDAAEEIRRLEARLAELRQRSASE